MAALPAGHDRGVTSPTLSEGQDAADGLPVPVLATRFDEQAIAISPDGRMMAYQSDATGTTEVFVRPYPEVDAAQWQVSNGGGTAPIWSRDGRELYYLSSTFDMMSVRVALRTGPAGPPARLFRLPESLRRVETDWYTPWDVAADGRFIMTRAIDPRRSTEGALVVVENFPEHLRARMRR
jgi:serine/threonine-protein kinase